MQNNIRIQTPAALNVFPALGFGLGIAIALTRKNKTENSLSLFVYPIMGLFIGSLPRLYYAGKAARETMKEIDEAKSRLIDDDIIKYIELLAKQNDSLILWKEKRNGVVSQISMLDSEHKRLMLEVFMAIAALPEDISENTRIAFTDKMEVLENKYGTARFRKVGKILEEINQIITLKETSSPDKTLNQTNAKNAEPFPEMENDEPVEFDVESYKRDIAKIKPNEEMKESALFSLVSAPVPSHIAA